MNLNLNLRQLKAFLGVAETRNFTRAAQSLHLSQAALSASIRELEGQLRCRLFERTTRSVALTAAGREFLPVAREVVQALERAAGALHQRGQDGISRLRLGFTPILASHVVPEVLDEFQRQFPQVQVDLVDAGPAELVSQLEGDQLDAVFGAFAEKRSGLAALEIAPATLMLVHGESFEGVGPRIAWPQVFEHPLVALTDASPVRQIVNLMARDAGVDLRPRMVVHQLETALGLVESGLGVAVFPSFARAAWRRFRVRASEIDPPASIGYFRLGKAGKAPGDALDGFTRLMIRHMRDAAPLEAAVIPPSPPSA